MPTPTAACAAPSSNAAINCVSAGTRLRRWEDSCIHGCSFAATSYPKPYLWHLHHNAFKSLPAGMGQMSDTRWALPPARTAPQTPAPAVARTPPGAAWPAGVASVVKLIRTITQHHATRLPACNGDSGAQRTQEYSGACLSCLSSLDGRWSLRVGGKRNGTTLS